MLNTAAITRADYNTVRDMIDRNELFLGEAGKTYDVAVITVEEFEAVNAFAKARKIKRLLIDEAVVIKEPKVTPAKKAAAKKAEPKAEPKAPRACDEKDCDGAYYSKGKCSKHYAQARRQDPIEKAKANEASKAYYARQRAAAVPATV